MFAKLRKRGFQVLALHHAQAILKHNMKAAVSELETILADIKIPMSERVTGGGVGRWSHSRT